MAATLRCNSVPLYPIVEFNGTKERVARSEVRHCICFQMSGCRLVPVLNFTVIFIVRLLCCQIKRWWLEPRVSWQGGVLAGDVNRRVMHRERHGARPEVTFDVEPRLTLNHPLLSKQLTSESSSIDVFIRILSLGFLCHFIQTLDIVAASCRARQ